MNRIKIVVSYILGFICTVLIASIMGLFILKTTVFNKDYVYKMLNKNNYYSEVSNKIKEDMENYMMSSGFPETIIDSLYSEEDIKKDINNFIDNIYNGKTIKFDNEYLKERLTNNINQYLGTHDVKVTNQSDIDSFVAEMGKIYDNNVHLYGMVNGFVNQFNKLSNVVNKVLILLVITFIILFIMLLFTFKINYLGGVLGASGLIMLFIRLVIFEKIDFQNINIISDNFSIILRNIFDDLGSLMFTYSLLLMVVGIILSILLSFKSNKALKRR